MKPSVIIPGGDATNLVIESAVTDFPDPLSFTIARHSPFWSDKLTFFIASIS